MTAAFNFARRDYTALFEEFLEWLKANVPEYTDYNHSDAGISIGRLDTSQHDKEHHYIDNAAQEAFIYWARFKQSLIDLGRNVDYLPTLAAAATTKMRLAPRDGVVATSVPQYSEFNRGDGLTYVTASAVTVPGSTGDPAADYVDVNAIQGILVEQVFQPSDFKLLDWTKHPRVNLGKSVAGGGFTEVWHIPGGTGVPPVYWTEVDSFWRSGPDDLHYLLELNGEDDTVWLVLGDGVKGMLPPAETLHVRFIRTAEAAGNCGHSVITGLPDGYSNLITCTNIEPATGGAPAESTESIRRMIPRMVRTQRRGLTKADYETLLEHFPGILHVQALDREMSATAGSSSHAGGVIALREALWGPGNSYGWPHEYIVLVVVPDGGGPMSSLLKDAIWRECGSWGHLGPWKERYILLDAITVPLNVAVRIGISPGYSPDTLKAAVEAAIATVLTPQNRTIGGALEFSELHSTVSAVSGVSWAEFDAPKEDVPGVAGHIVTAGAVTVTVM